METCVVSSVVRHMAVSPDDNLFPDVATAAGRITLRRIDVQLGLKARALPAVTAEECERSLSICKQKSDRHLMFRAAYCCLWWQKVGGV